MATSPSDESPSETDLLSTDITIPEDISSSTAKLVYLYIHSVGQTTVEEIRSALDMKKLTLLGILPILISQGYVVRDGDDLASDSD